MAKHYQPEKSLLFEYLSMEKLPILYNKIMEAGTLLLTGYNRAFASVNELMYFLFYFSFIFILYLLWKKYKKLEANINMRLFLFIFIGSMFALIPLYQFSGGLFSIITHMLVVNRLYYSASLFILIPIFTYAILHHYKLRYINLFIGLTLVAITVFSKYSNIMHHNYYHNIQSIQNSFQERRVGFNLSKEQIQAIKEKIQFHEQNNTTPKAIKYYARADIAFVIKYIYKKDVNWKGRFGDMDYKNNYNKDKSNHMIQHILFEIPKGFPSFIPYR